MMYKGTEKVGPEEFSRIIQANGGDDNAFTTRDYTSFFVNISADRIQIPIDLEADRMQNLFLREVDFRTEHMVIMEERRLTTEDDPRTYVSEQREAAAFQISPYHWPVIGWKEDIESFTLDKKGRWFPSGRPKGKYLISLATLAPETGAYALRHLRGLNSDPHVNISAMNGVVAGALFNLEPEGQVRVTAEKLAELTANLRKTVDTSAVSSEKLTNELEPRLLKQGQQAARR